MTRGDGPKSADWRSDHSRLDLAIIASAVGLSTATVYESSGKRGAMPHAIKPVSTGMRVCGNVVSVQSPAGDNLWIHRALCLAGAGDVLVVHVGGKYDHGYWGEVMSTAAKARGLSGLVIDGCVRDGELLEQIGFPVFARGLCVTGTGKEPGALGSINEPTLFGNLVVTAGDLILGDRDGVVVIEQHRAREVIEAAKRRDIEESAICQRLTSGENTLQIYGWK